MLRLKYGNIDVHGRAVLAIGGRQGAKHPLNPRNLLLKHQSCLLLPPTPYPWQDLLDMALAMDCGSLQHLK